MELNDDFFFNVLLYQKLHKHEYEKYNDIYYDIIDKINELDTFTRNKLLSFHYYLKYVEFNIPVYSCISVTDRCQLKCKHCYFGNKEHYSDITLDGVKTYYTKYNKLIDYFNQLGFSQDRKIFHNIMGGEPTLHPDIVKIIKILSQNDAIIKIVSNGIIYNPDIVSALDVLKHHPTYQISLDGTEYWHDFNRGDGVYKQALTTISKIRANSKNIDIYAAFNAHTLNYKCIYDLTREVKEAGATSIKFDRYLPVNNVLKNITTKQMYEYQELIRKCVNDFSDDNFVVKNNRTMQDDKDAVCTASLIHQTCMTNGDRYLCPRYQIKSGNWFTDDIATLAKNALYWHMKTQQVPPECFTCNIVDKCHGGMRCLTYAATGSMIKKDINCIHYEKI